MAWNKVGTKKMVVFIGGKKYQYCNKLLNNRFLRVSLLNCSHTQLIIRLGTNWDMISAFGATSNLPPEMFWRNTSVQMSRFGDAFPTDSRQERNLDLFFSFCSSSISKFSMLCILRCFSVLHLCKE